MSVNHQPLSRTSSSSSVLSDGTTTETSTNDELPLGSTTNIPSSSSTSSTGAPTESAAPKRTRKRFTNAQLTLLEDLFHQTSHPSRDQRDKLAKEAGLEIRSVTVWFQNKRQTERKVALSNGTAPPSIRKRHDSHSSNTNNNTTPLPLHSISSTPSISTSKSGRIGPRHQRTHSSSMMGIQHRYPSLDDIATRSERPQVIPRTPTRLRTYSSPNVSSNSNSTHPHLQQIPSYGGCVPTSSSESGGGNERPLWENMPSSPLGPSSPERRRDRDLLDFGMGRRGVGGRRIWTLEWACAKARVKGARDEEDEGEDDDDDEEDEDEDQEEADRTIRRSRHHHTSNLTPNPLINQLGVLILPNSNSNPNLEDEEMDLDTTGGDTEDDEVDPPHEALTPSNSISLCGTHSTKKPRTSSRSISSQSIGFGESSSQEDYATVRARGRGKNVSGKGNVHDEEMMDAALALCGLGRRGSS